MTAELNIEAERAAFETCAAERWDPSEMAMRHGDAYLPISLNAAWKAWRASIAADRAQQQQAGAVAPTHETIVSEGDTLVCTACGTTATPQDQGAQQAVVAPSERWTCFHCSESFTDRASAALHFGSTERQAPICSVSQERYREMELRMEVYNAEDAEIHHQMAAMQTKHQQALRRAEEDGYAKGLRDADRYPDEAAMAAATPQDQGEPVAWIAYYDGVKSQNVARTLKEKAEIENIGKLMNSAAEITWEALYASPAQASAAPAELIKLLKAIRPNYGAVGSRDIDVAAQRKRIDRAIELLSASAAQEQARAAVPAIWQLVMDEVERATRKFPTWPTDPLHAVAVLGEEFGELTKAVLQTTYEPHKVKEGELHTEAIQTAAMALRFLASLDRYQFKPGAQHEQPALAAAPSPAAPQQPVAQVGEQSAAARDVFSKSAFEGIAMDIRCYLRDGDKAWLDLASSQALAEIERIDRQASKGATDGAVEGA